MVLNTDDGVERLKKCTKCHFNAPTAMLVCYNEDESWKRVYDGALSAPVDAAIVATHMMLAAHVDCCRKKAIITLMFMGYYIPFYNNTFDNRLE